MSILATIIQHSFESPNNCSQIKNNNNNNNNNNNKTNSYRTRRNKIITVCKMT